MRQVLTYSDQSEHDGYSVYFDKSCKEIGGYEPRIVTGESKWEALIEYLSRMKKDDIVLYVNRTSAIISGPLDPLFDQFDLNRKQTRKQTILVASQPLGLFGSMYSYVYKNSNVIGDVLVTDAQTLLNLCKNMTQTCGPEQKRLTEYFERNTDIDIQLDNQRWFFVFLTGQAIFYSHLSFRDDPEMPPGRKRVIYLADNEKYKPCVIYRDPGSDMSGIIRELGYKVDSSKVFPLPAKRFFIYDAMKSAFNKGKSLFYS